MKKLLKAIVTFTLSVSMLTASFLFVGCDKGGDDATENFKETQFTSDYGVTWSTDKIASETLFAKTLVVGEKSCAMAETSKYGEVTLAQTNEKIKGLVLTSSTTLENRGGGYFTLGVRPDVNKCTFNGKEGRALIKMFFAPTFTKNRETGVFSISFSSASDKNNIITFEAKPEGDGYLSWNVTVKGAQVKTGVKSMYIPADGSAKYPFEVYYDKDNGAFYFGYNGKFAKMFDKNDGAGLMTFDGDIRICFGVASMSDSLISAINGGTYGNEAKSKSTKFVITECNGYDFSKENFLIADDEFKISTKNIKMVFDQAKDLLKGIKLAHNTFGNFSGAALLNGGAVEVYRNDVKVRTISVLENTAMASLTEGRYVAKYKKNNGEYLKLDGKEVEVIITVSDEEILTAEDVLDGIIEDEHCAKDPYLGEVYVKKAQSTVSGLVITSSKIRDGYTEHGFVNTTLGDLDLSTYTYDPVSGTGDSIVSFCLVPQYRDTWEWNSVYVYFDLLDASGSPILDSRYNPVTYTLILSNGGDKWFWKEVSNTNNPQTFPIEAGETTEPVSVKYDYKTGRVYIVYGEESLCMLDASSPEYYSQYMADYNGFTNVRIRIGHNAIQQAIRQSIGENDNDPGSIMVVTEFGGVDLTDF